MVNIVGTGSSDSLKGRTGSDTIQGRSGSDTIVGNAEANKELLVGGSFESAKIADGSWGTVQSVGGWRTDTKIEVWGKDFLGVHATDGSKVIELDADGRFSRLWQDVQTTNGETYSFSFDYAARAGTSATTNTIEVYWNNQLVGTFDPSSTAWNKGTLSLVGTGGVDRLEFREQASDNNTLGGLIDNVSLRTAASGQDVLIGGRGNDHIDGLSGDDIIFGGGQPSNNNAPSVAGVQDNDTIYAGAGNDNVHGGHGDDLIYGEDGNDALFGGRGNDVIDGGSNDDTIHGHSGNDTIRDGSGNDWAYGGSGDDTFIAGAGNDRYYGGSGIDILSYRDATSGVKVDLSKHTATGMGNDQFYNIEGIEGSAFNDRIKGSKHDDIISGGAGNDSLRGGAGADVLAGGEGSDTFIWRAADIENKIAHGKVDHVTDFSSSDHLDISQYTQGMSLADVVSTFDIQSDGTNSHLSITTNTGTHEFAVLENYQAASLATMISDGRILI